MSLFNYFKRKTSDVLEEVIITSTSSVRDSNCTDNITIDLTRAEQGEVKTQLVKVENQKSTRKPYNKWTPEERAEIGRYASHHGVSSTIRHFHLKYPTLKKQTVSDFKKGYESQLKIDPTVSKLIGKKRGRPSLLPQELMDKTIATVRALRLKGAPISCNVINAIGKGIVTANNRGMLIENGGHLSFTDTWARNILYEIERTGTKMTQRIATTAKIPIAPGILSEEKLTFQRKIRQCKLWHEIPNDLVLNFDQTPLSYICTGKTTLEERGTKNVPLVGKGKQKQITGTFTITAMGEFLPMQVIYEGKTPRCYPVGIEFPDGFNITCSKNHWSNERKAIEHLQTIIFPYLAKKREELNLPTHHKAMLIFDVFKRQCTDTVLKLMDENDCAFVFVPPNLTNHFQPLDLNINGFAKTFLKKEFQEWYAKKVQAQLDSGRNVYDISVDTKLSVIKPLHARWLISLYDNLRNKENMINKAFEMSSISEALDDDFVLEEEDPFHDL